MTSHRLEIKICGLRDPAEAVGLSTVQLHGEETPETVEALRVAGLRVIKALKSLADGGEKLMQDAARYAGADAWLIEGGMRGGSLPGGNGQTWAWSGAATLHCAARPFALAGGLSQENIREAILMARPHAVDVSSGVERAPGVKDMARVAAMVAMVHATGLEGRVAPVFCRGTPRAAGEHERP